jgi:hypothetical protein
LVFFEYSNSIVFSLIAALSAGTAAAS